MTHVSMSLRVALAFVTCAMAPPAIAEPLEEHIQSLLRCNEGPSTLPLLLFLSSSGRIDTETPLITYDGITCWRIDPDLVVRGAAFNGICASDMDPFLIEQYPEFYWRAPGMPAPKTLALMSEGSVAQLSAWAETEYLPEDAVRQQENGLARSQVECSKLW